MEFPHLDARANGRNGIDLPRPVPSGLSIAAVGLLPLALGLADLIRPLSGFVFAAIFLVVGALRSTLAYHELIGLRRLADVELRREPRPYLFSSLAQWRASELTSDRHRLALARSVSRTERDLSPALLPGVSPLNRVAARPHHKLFGQLAVRLAALDRPVTPQAVLDLEDLLTSPNSPLSARERAPELRSSLLTSLHALDSLAFSFPAEPAPANGQQRIPAETQAGRPPARKTLRPHIPGLRAAQTHLRRLPMAPRRSQR